MTLSKRDQGIVTPKRPKSRRQRAAAVRIAEKAQARMDAEAVAA